MPQPWGGAESSDEAAGCGKMEAHQCGLKVEGGDFWTDDAGCERESFRCSGLSKCKKKGRTFGE